GSGVDLVAAAEHLLDLIEEHVLRLLVAVAVPGHAGGPLLRGLLHRRVLLHVAGDVVAQGDDAGQRSLADGVGEILLDRGALARRGRDRRRARGHGAGRARRPRRPAPGSGTAGRPGAAGRHGQLSNYASPRRIRTAANPSSTAAYAQNTPNPVHGASDVAGSGCTVVTASPAAPGRYLPISSD